MASAGNMKNKLSGVLRLPLVVSCAAVAISFCSCQSLPREQNAPVPASRGVSVPPAQLSSNPKQPPQFQRPQAIAPAYPVQSAGFHRHAGGQPHGGGCPCCGGNGTLPAFAFSGAAAAECA